MTRISRSVATAAALLWASDAFAGEYRVELVELRGEHSHIDAPSVVEVDLEQEFREIEAVWLELEGFARRGWGEPLVDGEPGGREVPMLVHASVSLSDVFEGAVFDLRSPVARTEDLKGAFRVTAPLARTAGAPSADVAQGGLRGKTLPFGTDWSFLLDGRAALRATWRSTGCGDTGCRYVEHPTADVSRAVLVVQGTPR